MLTAKFRDTYRYDMVYYLSDEKNCKKILHDVDEECCTYITILLKKHKGTTCGTNARLSGDISLP